MPKWMESDKQYKDSPGPAIDESPGSAGGLTRTPTPPDMGSAPDMGVPGPTIIRRIERRPPGGAGKWGSTPAHAGEDKAWREHGKMEPY